MNNFQAPVVMQSAPTVLTRRSVKRHIDPIDAPARALGAKRSALVMKRSGTAALAACRNTALAATGDSLLVSTDGAVSFLLRTTNYGLMMERTQSQGTGIRLIQTMVFRDEKSFDTWCAVEPLRFEDGLLFSKLVRVGHAAFAGKR